MISKWPDYKEEWNFPEEERAIETIKEAVRGIRNIRSKMNVPPSKKVPIILLSKKEEVLEIFREGESFFLSLASASQMTMQRGQEGIPEDAVSVVISDAILYIPLEQLVDKKAEVERLEKEEKRLEGELKRVNAMLANEKFMSKAPKKKIEEEKEKLEDYTKKMEQVRDRLLQLR